MPAPTTVFVGAWLKYNRGAGPRLDLARPWGFPRARAGAAHASRNRESTFSRSHSFRPWGAKKAGQL